MYCVISVITFLTQVLKLLPLDFPLSVMKQFFIRSLRSTIDTSRTSRIQHNLAKGENLQVRNKIL